MFDRYVSGSRPSWSRRAVLIASLLFHGALGITLLLASFFHVVEISPPPLSIVFMSAPPPPPPGGEHATKTAATHPRPRLHPVATRAPAVQPVAPPVDDAPTDEPTDDGSDGPTGSGGGPGGPGSGPGVPGSTGTGPITSMAPIKPKNIAPHLLDAQRLAGSDPHLPPALIDARRGEHGLTFVARMCVDQSGAVTQVTVMQSLPGADADIINTLRRWRYKPQPIPVCFISNFVFDVD